MITNEEYTLLCDVLDEQQEELFKLEKTIEALKTNPSYRALFKKDYLKEKEIEKKKIDITIKALNLLRYEE